LGNPLPTSNIVRELAATVSHLLTLGSSLHGSNPCPGCIYGCNIRKSREEPTIRKNLTVASRLACCREGILLAPSTALSTTKTPRKRLASRVRSLLIKSPPQPTGGPAERNSPRRKSLCENLLRSVIPSGALDRTVQGGARNLALSIFNAVQDSSSSVRRRTPRNDIQTWFSHRLESRRLAQTRRSLACLRLSDSKRRMHPNNNHRDACATPRGRRHGPAGRDRPFRASQTPRSEVRASLPLPFSLYPLPFRRPGLDV
jgi:hypothetical protein